MVNFFFLYLVEPHQCIEQFVGFHFQQGYFVRKSMKLFSVVLNIAHILLTMLELVVEKSFMVNWQEPLLHESNIFGQHCMGSSRTLIVLIEVDSTMLRPHFLV